MDFVLFVVLTQPNSSLLRRQPDVSHHALRSTGGRSWWSGRLAEKLPSPLSHEMIVAGKCTTSEPVGIKSDRNLTGMHCVHCVCWWSILRMPGSSRTHLLLNGFPAWSEYIHVLFLHITDLHYTVTLNFKTRHNCVTYTRDAYQCNWWPVSLFSVKNISWQASLFQFCW